MNDASAFEKICVVVDPNASVGAWVVALLNEVDKSIRGGKSWRWDI